MDRVLLFGLSATFQIHTHSYYTLPFIPIAALSLGPVVMVMNRNAYYYYRVQEMFYTTFLLLIRFNANAIKKIL
jgi:hypothetical protein